MNSFKGAIKVFGQFSLGQAQDLPWVFSSQMVGGSQRGEMVEDLGDEASRCPVRGTQTGPCPGEVQAGRKAREPRVRGQGSRDFCHSGEKASSAKMEGRRATWGASYRHRGVWVPQDWSFLGLRGWNGQRTYTAVSPGNTKAGK